MGAGHQEPPGGDLREHLRAEEPRELEVTGARSELVHGGFQRSAVSRKIFVLLKLGGASYRFSDYLCVYCANSYKLVTKFIRLDNQISKSSYRVTSLVANLGWVDLDLGCSTTLLGQ